MSEHLMPLRHVQIAKAREALSEAEKIIARMLKLRRQYFRFPRGGGEPAPKTHWDQRAGQWLAALPGVLDGLPQTYNIGDLVRYKDREGNTVDGVITCTVTCHESYVVRPGDDRQASTEPLLMMSVNLLEKRDA